jgi:hypothetical protein
MNIRFTFILSATNSMEWKEEEEEKSVEAVDS